MTFRSHRTALAFAAAFTALSALSFAVHAAETAPGQPGADTSESAVMERSAPYMIMLVGPNGMTTEREVSAKTAAELMKTAKPVSSGVLVLVHGDKAYTVQNMVLHGGPYDGLSVMAALQASMP